MKFRLLALPLMTLLFLASSLAFAQTLTLQDDAADSFIERHFPNADIPGAVQGIFHYIDKYGNEKQGYAECFVPAMGGHSDGEVSTCTVHY